MKLIKLKLQGQHLPAVLPPVMKQAPVFSPLMSARFGTYEYIITYCSEVKNTVNRSQTQALITQRELSESAKKPQCSGLGNYTKSLS